MKSNHLTLFLGVNTLVLLFLFIVGVIIYFCETGVLVPIGRGTHIGYMTGIKTDGLYFKATTAYIKTSPTASDTIKYCIIDKSLVKLVKKSEDKRLEFMYIKPMISPSLYCKTNYIITGVLK